VPKIKPSGKTPHIAAVVYPKFIECRITERIKGQIMIKEVRATGKDVVEAKENARAALGAGELDDVKFEIIHAGSKGIFGIIGVKPAQVRAYMELPDPEERHRRRSERQRREERTSEAGESAAPAREKKNNKKKIKK
jgi:hypothetical protein